MTETVILIHSLIAGKLKEFNKKIPGSLRCVDNDLQALIQVCDEKKTPSTDMLSYLWRILNWPQGKIPLRFFQAEGSFGCRIF